MPAGPGGVDSNGVYLYGESDSASPVSDMLNLSAGSISTQFTNDRARLTSLETIANNPSYYVAASAAARDSHFGDPASMTATQRKTLQDLGAVVYRTDLGFEERFMALYNASTNPTGASAYGYYPVPNTVLFSGKRTNTAGVSVPTATYTVVSFNTYNVVGSISNTETLQLNSASAPSTFTVRKAGYYRLSSAAKHSGWSSTAGSLRTFGINKNSTTVTTQTLAIGPGTSFPADGHVVTYGTVNALLAAGDIIRFFLYQDSGVAATCSDHSVTIEYLRPTQV